jgi:uncharacterized protein YhaN
MLKPEIIHIVQREKEVCETAMTRLQEKTQLLEEQYGWSTHTFLDLFNAGKIGDEQAFFRWYALAEALQEWRDTHGYLQEILSNVDLVSA